MKCSRVLIAVLAVLCLATMVNADVINIQGMNYSSVAGWRTAADGMGMRYVGGSTPDSLAVYYAQYDISDIMSDPTVQIVSAKLIYSRDYWTNAGASTPATMSVSEPLYDYMLDTGSDWHSAAHMQLIGGNRGAVVLTAARIISQADVAINGLYYGTQTIDVTAIVQDWKNGAPNFNYSLGMGCTIDQNLSYGDFRPYLEVTTAPVPEPVTMCLLAVGGIATLLRRRNMA